MHSLRNESGSLPVHAPMPPVSCRTIKKPVTIVLLPQSAGKYYE